MPGIVVVSGGTAGWLTAAYLQSRLATEGSDLEVALIEPKDIPTIGVGEATVPSIRSSLAAVGVKEYDFMRACSATFKHGIKFKHWCKPPAEAPEHYYFHPFEKPLPAGLDNIGGHWLRGRDPENRPFADAVSIQQSVSSAGYAPKKFEDPSYSGPLPYAYHLDAGKLAAMLTEIGTARGVKRIHGKVQSIISNDHGTITGLKLDGDREVSADLYIDCTGFDGLLIEGHYETSFDDLTNTLFCDRAVSCQVPEDEGRYEIRPYTLATAQNSGWIWDIGLNNRRGTGHVFSSKYQNPDDAEQTLRDYIGEKGGDLSYRHLQMRVGTRKTQWHRNCVAIGLSAGFIEPLESTGIHLVEVAIAMLVQMIPRYLQEGEPQRRFNEIMYNQYKTAIDFIKLHYYLSDRRDTEFWIDNTDEASLEDDLREKIRAWRAGYPDVYDLRFVHSIFDHSSYQYIFFGIGKKPESHLAMGDRDCQSAIARFSAVTDAVRKAKAILPYHNELVRKINNGY